MGHTENELGLIQYINNKLSYTKKWESNTCDNPYVQNILDKSSKRGTGNRGKPDLIYCNDEKKLLILLENKPKLKYHISHDELNPIKYAVDGIKHYLSYFCHNNLDKFSINLKNWKIIGIAFSGDIDSSEDYSYRLDTFYIQNNEILDAHINEFLNENDYYYLFKNNELEEITIKVAKSSKEINQKLRDIDTNNRSILISALMISLFPRNYDYFNYKDLKSDEIIQLLPHKISKVLSNEGVSKDKIDILTNKLLFLKDGELSGNNIIKEILDELNENIIPLFGQKSNYDIIGKFYSEFLRYAGITDVKKGIVLTPSHITSFFANLLEQLLELGPKDVIFDPCCGTGSFLIAGMNKIDNIIENSELRDKKEKEMQFRNEQLLGFEKNTTMYILAISNMLFRGDGKSKIYKIDFFSEQALEILNETKPTIGFINPPYAGKDNDKNPTKKEIQFLERMLDNVSKYGIRNVKRKSSISSSR